MVFLSMAVASVLFAIAFRFLLMMWRALCARGRRGLAHALLAIGFLIAYLAYSLGYFALNAELLTRFRGVRLFSDWTDDFAAIVPFAIAIVMMVGRRDAPHSGAEHPSPLS